MWRAVLGGVGSHGCLGTALPAAASLSRSLKVLRAVSLLASGFSHHISGQDYSPT